MWAFLFTYLRLPKPSRFLTRPMNTSLRYPLLQEHGKSVLRIVLGSLATTRLMASFNCLCALQF